MILIIIGFALMRWRMARQFTPDEPATKIPYNPADRFIYARMTALWRKIMLCWIGVFTVLLASYMGAEAEAESAAAVVIECTDRLKEAPLQACLEVGHEKAMDAAGRAASLGVWVWVVGVL